MQNGFELKVSGPTFGDVVNTMRGIVEATDQLNPSNIPVTTTGKTKKPTKKAALATEDTDLMGDMEDEETETISASALEEESFDEAEEDDEEPTPAPKKAKATKVTEKEVNAAALAHAKANGGKAATAGVLLKKFKVKSLIELKPEQYADVIKALAVK